MFSLSYLCFYADLICCNLLFGPLSLQVVAAIKFTSLDCCVYLEACISIGCQLLVSLLLTFILGDRSSCHHNVHLPCE